MKRFIFIVLIIIVGVFLSAATYINGVEVVSNLGVGTLDVDTIMGPVTIGDAGSSSRSLVDDDDLFVSGKLEVDGTLYFDSTVYHNSTSYFGANSRYNDDRFSFYGTSNDSGIIYSAAQTADSLMLAVGSDSNSILITEMADYATDFGHSIQTNPTIFLHSADNTNLDQWGSLVHNQTDFLLSSGEGDIVLNPEQAERLRISDDDAKVTVTGEFQATDYYSGDGTQGVTDSTSFWMCTAADCATKCQVVIKDGLITSCS